MHEGDRSSILVHSNQPELKFGRDGEPWPNFIFIRSPSGHQTSEAGVTPGKATEGKASQRRDLTNRSQIGLSWLAKETSRGRIPAKCWPRFVQLDASVCRLVGRPATRAGQRAGRQACTHDRPPSIIFALRLHGNGMRILYASATATTWLRSLIWPSHFCMQASAPLGRNSHCMIMLNHVY